jgi:hypothetical protein
MGRSLLEGFSGPCPTARAQPAHCASAHGMPRSLATARNPSRRLRGTPQATGKPRNGNAPRDGSNERLNILAIGASGMCACQLGCTRGGAGLVGIWDLAMPASSLKMTAWRGRRRDKERTGLIMGTDWPIRRYTSTCRAKGGRHACRKSLCARRAGQQAAMGKAGSARGSFVGTLPCRPDRRVLRCVGSART